MSSGGGMLGGLGFWFGRSETQPISWKTAGFVVKTLDLGGAWNRSTQARPRFLAQSQCSRTG